MVKAVVNSNKLESQKKIILHWSAKIKFMTNIPVKFLILLFVAMLPFLGCILLAQAQRVFMHDDTLRGAINSERDWWDVMRYDIKLTPDFNCKKNYRLK